MALEEHLNFAKLKVIETGPKFADAVVDLVSSRPSVFAEAIDSFADLRSLVIRITRSQFVDCLEAGSESNRAGAVNAVIVKPRKVSPLSCSEMRLSLSVIRSISVVLSTWVDSFDDDESKTSIELLSEALLRSGFQESQEAEGDSAGLTGAVMEESKLAAVTVDWVSLLLTLLTSLFYVFVSLCTLFLVDHACKGPKRYDCPQGRTVGANGVSAPAAALFWVAAVLFGNDD